jgi:hypothetical protein
MRWSCARKNCVLADCRFTAAVASADELEATEFAAKATLQVTSSAAAKTGETRAKLLWKKREGKKRWNARELHAFNVLKTHAKFFRLNFMHNPPTQTR